MLSGHPICNNIKPEAAINIIAQLFSLSEVYLAFEFPLFGADRENKWKKSGTTVVKVKLWRYTDGNGDASAADTIKKFAPLEKC